MLKRFRANNFRSLLNVEFQPAGINLLVGPNNAGKTNLCYAMRFIGHSSQQPLDAALQKAIGERWNVTNLYAPEAKNLDFEVECDLQYQGQPLRFSYNLRLESVRSDARTETAVAESLRVVEETLNASGGQFADTVLLENHAGRARMLHERGFVEKRPGAPFYAEASAPQTATVLCQLYELENNPRAILFRRYLQSWSYYSFNPDALRLPDVARDDGALLSTGANLSRAMYDLHNQKPRLERKLIEAVRELEPRLDLFSFHAPDPEHVHLFAEDEKGHHFSTRSLSDGSLRFVAIAYIVLAAAQQAETSGLAPLVLIEEPENGLYVGQLKPLLQRIEPDGKLGQFVFTTHSPYFIDLFDNHLEGVHILRPGVPSSVLGKPDAERIKRLLKDMPLGEMHFRELLG